VPQAANVRFPPIADVGPNIDTTLMNGKCALLQLGDSPPVEVIDEHHLRSLLERLSALGNGEVATLRRGPSDFIKATRHAELWAVTAKRDGMWTPQSFTAEMTSESSERRVREGRQHSSPRSRLAWWLRSPPPERALSTNQVSTLFAEYLAGRKFTLPMSGASI
jgi:hypothetical protein